MNFVQKKNPRTQLYIKIDVDKGVIVEHKKTKGAYKGIKIVDRFRATNKLFSRF